MYVRYQIWNQSYEYKWPQQHNHNVNIWDSRECSPCIDNIRNKNCCQIRGIDHITVPEINKLIRKKFFHGQQRKEESSGWKVEG